ncbi:hypothetical protein ROLI_033530 [Roseobacter fucihabitans]|uniref:Iminophenyl-pyruvate dimer synthase domain-containing protein n=1 Tax=Roseobacter fucihabitans TaxID=1537242 RepID=A0ABZ2BWR5_9RHOB|nr:ferritin-like domain-containing protein [Roseobacter litoralis]MBC6966771.1 Violacein biosynthesis protein VioB [Roseobacter litoralis]
MRIHSYFSTKLFSRPEFGADGANLAAALSQSPPPAVSPRLEPRDETVFWLTAAAEVEHFLMTHYLFAAYTLKLVDGGGTSEDFKALQTALLQIAREEMGHLITVQNLLTLVGAPLHFGREHSPFASEIYPFRFKLERVSLDSLAKYALAESPIDRSALEAGLGPDDLRLYDTEIARRALASNDGHPVRHVGPIFARLRELFADHLTASDLRLDRHDRQARWRDWGYKPNPRDGIDTDLRVLVHSFDQTDPDDAREAAVQAIQDIGDQGEEADLDMGDGESHFERFFQAYKDLAAIEEVHGTAPVWPVSANPNLSLDVQDGADNAGRITLPRTRLWAQLFNLRYRLLLRFLSHALQLDGPVFLTGGATMGDRTAKGLIVYWAFKEMRRLKKIAAKLVQLPATDLPNSHHAGPPFELPFRLDLAPDEGDRWVGHRDVFRAAITLTEKMQAEDPDTNDPFLAYLRSDDEQSASIADAMAATGKLPASLSLDDFQKVAAILDEAVRGFPVAGPHSAFWRNATLSDFLGHAFAPVTPGDPDGSGLIQRIAVAEDGANLMPRYRPRIDQRRVDYIVDWIARGAPDNAPPGQIGIAEEPTPSPEPAPHQMPQKQ